MLWKLSKHAEQACAIRNIEQKWIEEVLSQPSIVQEISHKEIHYWRRIEDKCLKVVFNPVKSLVVTVFFDRNTLRKGCGNAD